MFFFLSRTGSVAPACHNVCEMLALWSMYPLVVEVVLASQSRWLLDSGFGGLRTWKSW